MDIRDYSWILVIAHTRYSRNFDRRTRIGTLSEYFKNKDGNCDEKSVWPDNYRTVDLKPECGGLSFVLSSTPRPRW